MNDTLRSYFYEISAIPRPSGNEEKIADYLMSFAEAHGLSAVRDAANNVLIRKGGTADHEKAPAVLLQGHTDMVCEKNAGTAHDFLHEGIHIIEEGEFLRADGTTLGADNGYAVAAMLSILADKKIVHPPLECLFTTAEEIGLDGMQAFDKSILRARTMINLDSCDENVATAASAGGVTTHFRRTPAEKIPCGDTALRLTVSGLMGGHSGEDINRGRKNALKLGARLYHAAETATETHMISLYGGNKDNAIPRECTLTFTAADIAAAINAVREEEAKIRLTLCRDDESFNVEITTEESGGFALSDTDTTSLMTMIRLLPAGPLAMSNHVPGLVETSSNTAIVHADCREMRLTASSRSSVEAELDDLCTVLAAVAQCAGFSFAHCSRYPGWSFTADSRIQNVYLNTYRNLFGKEGRIIGIHAGLECGLVKQAIPDMDILSIGPDMFDIHTPAEKLSLPSAERVYQLLIRMLAAL